VAIVLSLLAGGATIFFLVGRKPPVALPQEAKSVDPVRPVVETLPAIHGTDQGGGQKGTTPPHVGDTPRPQEREMGSAAEEAIPGKKRIRSTSGEKRAILRQENEAEGGLGNRPNPFDDKTSVKKNKDPRPNPF
jgi:hypothetical protein